MRVESGRDISLPESGNSESGRWILEPVGGLAATLVVLVARRG
jgi:hypothetical protein